MSYGCPRFLDVLFGLLCTSKELCNCQNESMSYTYVEKARTEKLGAWKQN